MTGFFSMDDLSYKEYNDMTTDFDLLWGEERGSRSGADPGTWMCVCVSEGRGVLVS